MAVPAETPVTEPVEETVAILELEETQVPPAVPLLANVLDAPAHMVVVPDMLPPVGVACIDILRLVKKLPQPFGAVV